MAALALSRLMRAMLFRVDTGDVLTFVIALLAVYFPSRKAARVDPNVALRYE